MALVLLDRARETTIVVGTTASAILLGAVSGYQSLAGVGNGNTTYYCIAEQTGANWEVGLGTYTLVGTTITRAATPLSSSNAGASVNFPAGTKDIFIVYPSAKGVWLDASGNAIGLGTPAAFVGTNITGTATSFTASNVTTNANLTGDITSVGNATTLTNAPVIAKVLTGYTSGAGTVSATDSILQAIQKLNGNDATNANLTGAITSVGNATSLGSFTSANLATALTDETGTGANVFATSPTLVTPALGTPSALVGTNITGTATAFTASNVTTNANLTGAVTSVGNASSLGSFTSAQLATALTDKTGTGANVFATSPTLTSPVIAGTPSGVGTLTSMTNVATTSGTAFLFTGAPSWAKRITVMINGCVYNAATQILIQLGSTTLVTSGYVSYGNLASSGFASTAGYIAAGANATNSHYISAVLTLQTGNTWLCAMGGIIVNAGAGLQFNAGGTGATSSAVDRINITTVSGATWTAGSINIMYE